MTKLSESGPNLQVQNFTMAMFKTNLQFLAVNPKLYRLFQRLSGIPHPCYRENQQTFLNQTLQVYIPFLK